MMKKSLGALALVALLSLTACDAESNSPAAPQVDAAGDSAAHSESAEPKAEEPKRSDRGNILKEIGQGAGTYSADTKEQFASFVINSIEVDPVCTGPSAAQYPAENGHMLVLDVSIETFPALNELDWPTFGLAPYSMKVIAPNGTTSNANLGTTAAQVCLPDSETIPASVGPAEKVRGKLVLDSELPSGILVITEGGSPTGWEYNFGEVTPDA